MIDAGKAGYFVLGEAGPETVCRVRAVLAAAEGAELVLTGAGPEGVDAVLPGGGFGARYADGYLSAWVRNCRCRLTRGRAVREDDGSAGDEGGVR
ncbi:hypothetical protein [Kitasatospora cineracea]|uniref:hypothetical protein n=1 Tax=Kitasatospora cineracea TaxID=88074 RepID=UPI0038186C2C